MVKRDEGLQVLRKLSSLDSEAKILVEIFNMTEMKNFLKWIPKSLGDAKLTLQGPYLTIQRRLNLTIQITIIS